MLHSAYRTDMKIKQQHCVPRSYLRNFANERKQVHAYDKCDGRAFHTIIKNVAASPNPAQSTPRPPGRCGIATSTLRSCCTPPPSPAAPTKTTPAKLSWSLLHARRSRAFHAAHAPRQRLPQACVPGQPLCGFQGVAFGHLHAADRRLSFKRAQLHFKWGHRNSGLGGPVFRRLLPIIRTSSGRHPVFPSKQHSLRHTKRTDLLSSPAVQSHHSAGIRLRQYHLDRMHHVSPD